MKTIGFIGAYDKTDMLLNIAKILTVMGKNVLLVDSTLNQKARYVVPTITPTASYITTFEDIDIAVGFENRNTMENYMGLETEELPYDIVLVDCDSIERIKDFKLETADRNYFVTSFDIYSLRKGMEILENFQVSIKFIKVIFAKDIIKEEDDFFNYISKDYKITWSNDKIYFPLENGDTSVNEENQRLQKIRFKKLSVQYKDSIGFIVQQILELNSDSSVRRAMKTIEKGV